MFLEIQQFLEEPAPDGGVVSFYFAVILLILTVCIDGPLFALFALMAWRNGLELRHERERPGADGN